MKFLSNLNIDILFFSENRSVKDEMYNKGQKKGDNISIYSLPLHFNKVLTGSHGGDAIPDLEIPRYIRLMASKKMFLFV